MEQHTAEVLTEACFNGHLDVVTFLIQSGADINALGRNWNPLHAAIENMEVAIVRYLLEAGADTEYICEGMRPLHHAIDIEIDAATQANAPELPEPLITQILLERGANRNGRDATGRTPLQMARSRGHTKAEHLLQTG